MRLELEHPVQCRDGANGELADVVVDQRQRRVTHLVVKLHDGDRGARLVPVELATANASSAAVEINCSVEELRRLPHVEESAFLRAGEFPVEDPDWDIGIETVLTQPYFDYPGFVGSPMGFDAYVSILYDRIPKGRVEIRRASEVVSADDHRLGHVDGFLVDADDRITHIVLERGHLFGRREVTIPIEAVARVENDSVTLKLTKDEAGRVPVVRVHRWPARLSGSGAREQANGDVTAP